LEAVDSPDAVSRGAVPEDCREIADRLSKCLDPVARLYYKYWCSYSHLLQSTGEPLPNVWIAGNGQRAWLRRHLDKSNRARSVGISMADVGSDSLASPSVDIGPQTVHVDAQLVVEDVAEAPAGARTLLNDGQAAGTEAKGAEATSAEEEAAEAAETEIGSSKRRRRSSSDDDEDDDFDTKRRRQGKNNAFFVNGGSFVFNQCTFAGKRG
jgi:hypothetical protein